MNDIYGIDPCAPSSRRDVVDILRLFSPSSGRFIADFPCGWFLSLHEHVSQQSDLAQLMTVELRRKLAHAVIPTPKRGIPNKSWEENALQIKNDVRLLIGQIGSKNPLITPIDKALSDVDAFRDCKGALIEQTVAAYTNAAKPILHTSPKLVIVDPYFSLVYYHRASGSIRTNTKACKLLSSFIAECINFGKTEVFDIFCSFEKCAYDFESMDSFEDAYCKTIEKIIDDLNAPDAFEYGLFDITHEIANNQHARYLLGMNSGLHFDHGFVLKENQTNHVEWISEQALHPVLDVFT